MIFRAKAPLRMSFGGGGTDVPPYPELYGGVVLSATIDKYAYASLITREDGELYIDSLDYNVAARYGADQDLFFDGKLDLVKAAVRNMGDRRGANLFLHSDAPPGTGLGSSSAVVVALIGVLKDWLREPLAPYEIAERAVQIERHELGIEGGLQDQYSATFGGFNLIEFGPSSVVVNQLRIDQRHVNELHYRLLLCYTGKAHVSGQILSRQIDSYRRRESQVMESLHRMKELSIEMKNSLVRGQIDEFGRLLHQSWTSKKMLDKQITDPTIDMMYEVARRNGAIGGKILGAGGGGYLLLCCEFDRKHVVAEKLEQLGGTIVGFSWEPNGLQTWTVNDSADESRGLSYRSASDVAGVSAFRS